jgi:hypothetical protein
MFSKTFTRVPFFMSIFNCALYWAIEKPGKSKKNKNINKTTSPFFFLGGRKKSFSFIAL